MYLFEREKEWALEHGGGESSAEAEGVGEKQMPCWVGVWDGAGSQGPGTSGMDDFFFFLKEDKVTQSFWNFTHLWSLLRDGDCTSGIKRETSSEGLSDYQNTQLRGRTGAQGQTACFQEQARFSTPQSLNIYSTWCCSYGSLSFHWAALKVGE